MRPNNAPRCFGLPSMYGADAAICGVCRFHDDCGPSAKSMLSKLKEEIDVGNVGSMHVATNVPKVSKSADKSKPLRAQNPKLTTLVNQILKAAPDAHERLSAGINPFIVSTKPAFLKPLVDIALSNDSSEDRMIRLLVEVFDKSQAEAEKQISLFKSALDVIATKKEES